MYSKVLHNQCVPHTELSDHGIAESSTSQLVIQRKSSLNPCTVNNCADACTTSRSRSHLKHHHKRPAHSITSSRRLHGSSINRGRKLQRSLSPCPWFSTRRRHPKYGEYGISKSRNRSSHESSLLQSRPCGGVSSERTHSSFL